MTTTCKKALSLLSFYIACLSGSYAQRWEPGIAIGAAAYKGDLRSEFGVFSTRPAFSAFCRYNFSMVAALRLSAVQSRLAINGTNSSNVYIQKVAPNAFNTNLTELGLVGEYNFYNFRDPKTKYIFGTPHLFGGLAVFLFNPKIGEPGGVANPLQISIPFGVGYKQKVNHHWNIGVEFGARKTFTDYLDNVSHMDFSGLQRGTREDKDMYGFLSFTISYTIKEIICPFDNPYKRTND